MALDFSDSIHQNPANIVQPNGFIGTHKLFFVGATGNIGSGYGIPGVSATRISTGIYRVQHPPIKGLDIIAGIATPSGTTYHVNQSTEKTNSLSGTTEFHILADKGGASGTFSPSGAYKLTNPVSGTILRLAFFGAPQAVAPGQF